MTDATFKFVVCYFIIFIVVVTFNGIIYSTSETPSVSFQNLTQTYEDSPTSYIFMALGFLGEIAGRVVHIAGKCWDIVTIIFDIFTFALPNIPDVVRGVTAIVFNIMNFAFAIAIYPILKEFVQALGSILSAIGEIIPF